MTHCIVWPDWLPPMTVEEWCAQPVPDLLARRPFVQSSREGRKSVILPVTVPRLYFADGGFLRISDPYYSWRNKRYVPLNEIPYVDIYPAGMLPASWNRLGGPLSADRAKDVPVLSLLSFIAAQGGILKESFTNYEFDLKFSTSVDADTPPLFKSEAVSRIFRNEDSSP